MGLFSARSIVQREPAIGGSREDATSIRFSALRSLPSIRRTAEPSIHCRTLVENYYPTIQEWRAPPLRLVRGTHRRGPRQPRLGNRPIPSRDGSCRYKQVNPRRIACNTNVTSRYAVSRLSRLPFRNRATAPRHRRPSQCQRNIKLSLLTFM